MKTPEEIKKGLRTCLDENCNGLCPYHGSRPCYAEMHTDALAYIQQLEESEERYRERLEIAYGKLQEACKELDGVENCTNCLYGDGSHDYCHDCRWFDGENDILKWVSKNELSRP